MGQTIRCDSMNVVACLSCGQEHESVELVRFNARGVGKAHPFHTHYYLCPVTKDPVSVSIRGEPETKLDEEVVNTMAECHLSGRWMFVGFHMHGNDMHYFRKTLDFPADEFRTCANKFKEDLDREVDGEKTEQLPRADLAARPMPKLFGFFDKKQKKGD